MLKTEVDDTQELTVVAPGQQEGASQVVGTDLQSDVVVNKVDTNDLPEAILGDSYEAKVG